jgi:phenylalanyl-tRNA synthetase beta chain
VLRTELTRGLVDAALHNVHVGNERIALFEVARVYLPAEGLPDERWHVAGIVEGDSHEEAYRRAKGAVELLYGAVGAAPRFDRVHDLAELGLEGAWAYFELDLHELLEAAPATRLYEDVITYPALMQDLAFVVDESVPAGDLVDAARAAAGPELRAARVFDVYRGEQTGPGKKSVAFSVEFQSPERTLSDEDAARLRERIVAALAERYGAVLRA